MELNKETILMQNEFRKFAKDVIAPKADEYDKKSEVPVDIVKKLAEMGMLGALVPESCGGVNLDTISTVVALEEISKVCPSTALILAVHNVLFAYPLVKYGTEEQKKKYLPQACEGELVGGFAETMTNELAIRIEGDSYFVKGKNPILLNGEMKGPFIIIASVTGTTDLAAMVIDKNTSAVEIIKNNNVIGMKAAGIAEVRFNDCPVPKTNRLGTEKTGSIALDEIRQLARLYFAAICLGISQGALENAIKYAKERVQFGEPIAHYGMVREMIVDIATKIEAMRLMTYDAAVLRDANKDFSRTAAIARCFAAQSVAEITTSAIQVYGGYGYMKDYPVERYFRDAQVIRVLCGTSAIDKEFIATKII